MRSIFDDFFNENFFQAQVPVTRSYYDSKIEGLDNKIVIKIPVPGLTKEDVDITVEKRTLKVKAENEHFKSEYSWLLNDNLNASEITGQVKNGLLILDIPKKESEVLKIEVA